MELSFGEEAQLAPRKGASWGEHGQASQVGLEMRVGEREEREKGSWLAGLGFVWCSGPEVGVRVPCELELVWCTLRAGTEGASIWIFSRFHRCGAERDEGRVGLRGSQQSISKSGVRLLCPFSSGLSREPLHTGKGTGLQGAAPVLLMVARALWSLPHSRHLLFPPSDFQCRG